MADVRLSIVLATWQGERYLLKQLTSFLGQTRLPDELVVVDDASEDRTLAILEEFASVAPFRVQIIRNEVRQGSTVAFGTGLAAATGEIVAFADQDDLWLPQKLARLEAPFIEDPSTTFAFSDALVIDENDVADSTTMWQVRRFGADLQERVRTAPFSELAHRFLATGCTIAFRADLREALLPFPTGMSDTIPPMIHDRWLSIVLSGIGAVAVIDEPLVAYRVHTAQQIGLANISASKPPLQRYLGRLLTKREDRRSPRHYQLAHLVEARRRLADLGLAGEHALAEIDAVIRHQTLRCNMAERHTARIVPIIRELVLGRYHQYSRGWSSAAFDLLERHREPVAQAAPAPAAVPARRRPLVTPTKPITDRSAHVRDITATDHTCRTTPVRVPAAVALSGRPAPPASAPTDERGDLARGGAEEPAVGDAVRELADERAGEDGVG